MAGFVLLSWCTTTTPRALFAVLPLVFLRLAVIEYKLVLSAVLAIMPRYLAGEATSEVAFGTYHLRL